MKTTLKKKPKKFIVSMRVEGRIDIEVEAENVDEAFELANDAFMESDLKDMEVIDAEPVNAYDVETDTLTDK